MRRTYINGPDGKLVEVRRAAPRRRLMIIGDHHEPFQSCADGRIYESKSAYRRSLKEMGLEEVGNERAHVAQPKEYEPDERDIVDCLKASYREHGVDVV